MTDRLVTPVSSSNREQTRSVFSARKLALMASVVTGLGIAMYGFSPSSGSFDVFSTAAHAQVSNAVSSATQPTGFADMVEKVKPSVISVKVTMKEKTTDAANKSDDESGSPMGVSFVGSAARMACLRIPVVTVATAK